MPDILKYPTLAMQQQVLTSAKRQGQIKCITEIQPIKLQEYPWLPKNAREIVEMALGSIKKNYSQVPDMMTGFYRESIRQRRTYLSISEAVVDIYKAPYAKFQNDKVKIYKDERAPM